MVSGRDLIRPPASEDGGLLRLHHVTWPYLASVELDNPYNAPRASPVLSSSRLRNENPHDTTPGLIVLLYHVGFSLDSVVIIYFYLSKMKLCVLIKDC